jgi:hypothetical protein
MQAEQSNWWRAFWGMPESVAAGFLPEPFRILLRRVYSGVAIGLSLVLASAFVRIREKTANTEQLILSLTAATLGLMTYFYARGYASATGRVLTYGFGFLILALIVATVAALHSPRVWLRRGVSLLVGGWLILQIALGMGVPFTQYQILPDDTKRAAYDLEPITRYLQTHPPRTLLVDIPKTDDWQFAVYAMFVFQQYPAYFQSGIIVDNNASTPAWWFGALNDSPDYAVILRSADYIGIQNLGTPVAETQNVILYQITTNELAQFNAQEKILRARDGK